MFCALVSLSVSGYSISVGSVQEELQCSRILALLGITMFTITFGAAPLLLAPLSEVYGRSHIYLVSAFIFAVFFIPQALAKNIETILVTRFISGIAGSTAVSLVGGTLSDVWKGPERGGPMSLFSWAAFGSQFSFETVCSRSSKLTMFVLCYDSYRSRSSHVRLPRTNSWLPLRQLDHVRHVGAFHHCSDPRPRRDSSFGTTLPQSCSTTERNWRREIRLEGGL